MGKLLTMATGIPASRLPIFAHLLTCAILIVFQLSASGATRNSEKCEARLKNAQARSSSLIPVFKQFGFVRLKRRIDIGNLPKHLLAGSIAPEEGGRRLFLNITRNEGPDLSSMGILDLGTIGSGSNSLSGEFPYTARYPGGFRTISFEIAIEALTEDRQFSISSNGDNFGLVGDSDFVHSPRRADSAERLRSFLQRISDPGELVLNGPIDIRYLRAIWVVEIYRESLLQQLRAAGLTAINGHPLEEVILPVKIQGAYKVLPDGEVWLEKHPAMVGR